MNKIFIVLFAISITTVVSQSCSNFLASDFGIQTLNSTTNETTGLYYCKSLNNSDSCCHATTINGFQQKADDMIARLTSLVSKRDIFLIQKRNEVWKLRGTLNRLKVASDNALLAITTQGGLSFNISGGSGGSGFLGSGNGGQAFAVMIVAAVFSEMAGQITENMTSLQSNFTLYQQKRSECVIELVKTQAAAWCLACDPLAGSKGLSGGLLSLGYELQERIIGSCGEFIVLAAEQSIFLSLYYMSAALNGMANALERIGNGDLDGGVEGFFLAMTASSSLAPPSLDEQKVVELPSYCTKSQCSWIFEKLFYNGKINETLLAAGGELSSDTSGTGDMFTRLLRERDDEEDVEDVIVGRKLQSGGWNPDVDEAGVNITFSTNPGKVNNNKLSGFRTGLVGFSLAVLAVLFF